MLLNILKINNYQAYVYLFLYSLIFVIFSLYFSLNAWSFDFSILTYVFKIAYSGWLYSLAGAFLLFANGLVFDLFLVSQEIVEKNNHIPSFLIAVFLSIVSSLNPLHPILISQLLMSTSLWCFLSAYKADRSYSPVFNGAFFLSAASLFYPPFIIFLPLAVICLLVLRTFYLREWVLVLVGILSPYLICSAMMFLGNENPQQALLNLANSFYSPSIPGYLKGSFLFNG